MEIKNRLFEPSVILASLRPGDLFTVEEDNTPNLVYMITDWNWEIDETDITVICLTGSDPGEALDMTDSVRVFKVYYQLEAINQPDEVTDEEKDE